LLLVVEHDLVGDLSCSQLFAFPEFVCHWGPFYS
jgi:hypothetical protein